MSLKRKGGKGDASTKLRIAIVDGDKCKPKKCQQECKVYCPVNRMGKKCIEVTRKSKISYISESLCIGCGICVQKCPFEAISIINLPKDLGSATTHRYGPNSFKLHRLPTPRPGQVLGLVGTNGIGKSTALKILGGKMKPNLGIFEGMGPDWSEILTYFRGSELQNYLSKIVVDDLTVSLKPQFVDHIPRSIMGQVGAILGKMDQREISEKVMDILDLKHVATRRLDVLSGGELQRFAIAVTTVQDKNVYMFDEPSSYLDVKQRLNAAQLIRSIVDGDAGQKRYVVVVEHDLSVLDYLSDFICVLYGVPGAYGVVTMPFSVREGINVFLAGYIPTENMRFRTEELTFKVSQQLENDVVDANGDKPGFHTYPDMTKTLVPKIRKRKKKKKKKFRKRTSFKLHVKRGGFRDAQIVVMLGENGTGKTTFIRMLAGVMKPDEAEEDEDAVPKFNISYKPQKIVPRFEGTVQMLLVKKCPRMYGHPRFNNDVIKPLHVDKLYDQEVKHLSGGELQRVAITLCLGKPADLYLIDEPSAYLDSEQRIVAAKVIKRFIMNAKKTAYIVEHDFIMATYLADNVVVYEGTPGVECTANSPQPLLAGMNQFLKQLSITFRRDPINYRPRINKLNSIKDREQKKRGTYFYMDDE